MTARQLLFWAGPITNGQQGLMDSMHNKECKSHAWQGNSHMLYYQMWGPIISSLIDETKAKFVALANTQPSE
jgi:hypothetical protein